MDGTARVTDALDTVVREFGDQVVEDPDRVRALLNDLLGSDARAHRLEIDALVRVAANEAASDDAGQQLDGWAREAWEHTTAGPSAPATDEPAEPLVDLIKADRATKPLAPPTETMSGPPTFAVAE